MKTSNFCAILLLLLLLSSCAAPNVSYFNDFDNDQLQQITQQADIRLQPGDKISVVVKSKDSQLSELFNLPVTANRIGYTSSNSSNYSYTGQMSLYTIDSNGEIDFPVIGRIKVGNMNREEAAAYIKQQLTSQNMVQAPVVTVEYGNLGFNVMGEVIRPGRYTFDRDRLTILDAISMAQDLTIQGRRDNILVIRETKQGRMTYRVNLQSGKELLQSPAFYIQQNDVIYVSPNAYRSRQTTVNGNNVLSASFWISVASLLTSIAVLIVK